MASFASVHHHVWRTQAAWTKLFICSKLQVGTEVIQIRKTEYNNSPEDIHDTLLLSSTPNYTYEV